MSVIMTFMFEPAKLQMNCARASGTRIFRRAADGRPTLVPSAMRRAHDRLLIARSLELSRKGCRLILRGERLVGATWCFCVHLRMIRGTSPLPPGPDPVPGGIGGFPRRRSGTQGRMDRLDSKDGHGPSPDGVRAVPPGQAAAREELARRLRRVTGA